MKPSILTIILCLAITGCTEEELTTDEVFVLQEKQLLQTIASAKNGDMAAIRRLIAHYDAVKDDNNQAQAWRTQALILGDPEELYIYANKAAHKAMMEKDSLTKRQLLANALISAELSYKNRKDIYTLTLINKIKGEISGAPPAPLETTQAKEI
jgi:hypothetical protein